MHTATHSPPLTATKPQVGPPTPIYPTSVRDQNKHAHTHESERAKNCELRHRCFRTCTPACVCVTVGQNWFMCIYTTCMTCARAVATDRRACFWSGQRATSPRFNIKNLLSMRAYGCAFSRWHRMVKCVIAFENVRACGLRVRSERFVAFRASAAPTKCRNITSIRQLQFGH